MYQINKLIYKVNGEVEAYHAFRALNELKKIISNKYSFKYLTNSYLFSFDPLCEETVKEFVIEFGDEDHYIKYEYYFKVRSTPVDDGKLSNKILVKREGLKLNGFSLFERIGSNEGCFTISNGKYRKLNPFMDDILTISFEKYIENTESFVSALNELPEAWDEIEFTNPFNISFVESNMPLDVRLQLNKVYKPKFKSCMDEIDTSATSKSAIQTKDSPIDLTFTFKEKIIILVFGIGMGFSVWMGTYSLLNFIKTLF